MRIKTAQPTSTFTHIENAIDDLVAHKDEWATLPINDKIGLLRDTLSELNRYAKAWVDASINGKHLAPDSPWVGEEWVSGPWAVAGWLNAMVDTLTALAQGKHPPIKKIRTRPNGQVVAELQECGLELASEVPQHPHSWCV